MARQLIDKEHRKSIAEQAQEILEGKAKWGPTWQSLPGQAKFMKDIVAPTPEETNAVSIPKIEKLELKEKSNVLIPKIKKSDSRKGRTIRVF